MFSETKYRDSVKANAFIIVFVLSFITWSSHSNLYAQVTDGIETSKDVVYGQEGVDVLYTHTSGVHICAHTQGAGLGFRYGYFSDALTSKSLSTELLFFRHEKEEKTVNPVYTEGLPYVLGKVNSFLVLKILVESQRELTPKLRKGGVQVIRVFRYGLSLGFEKPVYLEIGYPEIPYDYLKTERYNPEEHFYNDIYGRSTWVNGLDEMTIIPGGHFSYGVIFEYGDMRAKQKTVELGTALDVFIRPIEIMASQFVDSQRTFLTLYLKMGIGSKWTQAR